MLKRYDNISLVAFSTSSYLTSRVDRLLRLLSAEAVSVRSNAHPQM